MGVEQLERLHGRRAHYERVLRQQFPRAFGEHDVEDIVSTALQRAMTASSGPRSGSEGSWFLKLLLNAARDELRRRDGRRMGGGSWRRTIPASQFAVDPFDRVVRPTDDEYDDVIDRLDATVDRTQSEQLVKKALADLDHRDARLLLLRHHSMAHATRDECAAAAGLTVSAWRHGYRRAWQHFVRAVSTEEPTPRCRMMRDLAGEIEAGIVVPSEAALARGRLDAHIMECASCHAFLRTSYRYLSPEWIGGGGAVAVGAGVAAVGFGAWVAGLGGLSGIAATVCVISVTTAGLCGGVLAVLGGDGRSEAPRRPAVAAAPTATATPRPSPSPAQSPPTAKPTRRATATPEPRREPEPVARRTTRTATQAQPAAPPTGGSGTDFVPEAESSTAAPAPVASGVSGEFAP